MVKRNLVLIHRGPEYEKDFTEIGRKVRAIDKDVIVYALPFRSTDQLPTLAWMWPTLVVSLAPRFKLEIKRGKILRNAPIEKLVQYEGKRRRAGPSDCATHVH